MNICKLALQAALLLLLVSCGEHSFLDEMFGISSSSGENEVLPSSSSGSSSASGGGGLAECPAYDAATQFCDARDSHIYRYVNINGQTWMAKNLNYNTNESKCYDNKPSNCEEYGKLYNWNEAQTACPSGWHLPNPDEIQTLINSAGGEEIAGVKVRSTGGWKGKVIGTDDYEFSAFPAGSDDSEGSFLGMNFYSCWWSSAEVNADSARGFITGNFEDLVDSLTEGLLKQLGGLGSAMSDVCNPELLASMGLTPGLLASMGMDLGGSIFGKSLCDFKKTGFDKMLMIGSEDKRRLISVRCLKDE